MADEDRKERLAFEERAEEADGRTVYLSGGRTLEVQDDVVEFRSPSGMLELRVRLTEEGPVLQVEGVKVAVKAAETVSVECKTFEVRAEEKVTIKSEGELDVESEKEMKITSTDDVRVRGKLIHLN